MSVLYALEAEGLAACALNTMFGWRREARVRRLLGIGSSERLITFVAVGTFREQNHVAKSTRFPLASITKVIG
jgi:hypothetical protein